MQKKIFAIAFASLMLCACASQKEEEKVVETITVSGKVTPGRTLRQIGGNIPTQDLPRAVVYKMSGNATIANVPVQVNSQGEIVSFPAPSDLNGCEPIELENGWLLDRRGVSENTVFTTYTYAEYSKLTTPPTLDELKAAIIPDAKVVDIHRLSMTPAEAAADTAAVIALTRGF